jgi:metal-responsive CopG/Arc/MetJ family transcriptional regulator
MSRKKVQITLPEDLKLQLEQESKEEFMSMSSWIERSIMAYLEKKKRKKGLIDLGI